MSNGASIYTIVQLTNTVLHSPGEVLPPFPKHTHAEYPPPGLKPWFSINQAIRGIPDNWADHDVARAPLRNLPATTGEELARTMTTSGTGLNHPSGRRGFTYREYACLQGFPLEHKFGKQGLKKQMGNAVPPSVAKTLLEEVIKALKKADGLSEDGP